MTGPFEKLHSGVSKLTDQQLSLWNFGFLTCKMRKVD
jgi:hypothetical protein